MAKKKATKIQEASQENPARKYVSIIPPIKEEWFTRATNVPFYDTATVSYAVVIQSGDLIKGEIFLPPESLSGRDDPVIDQESFPKISLEARTRILQYYNKRVNEANLLILEPATNIRHIHIATRPRQPNLFYVVIDAIIFDRIPDIGNYILTPITKLSTINQLAEEYKGFFRSNENTATGRRARIAEILRANLIDIFTAQKIDIEEWIYRINYGPTDPPGRDTKFNAGTEIYLPRVDPDLSRVDIGGKIIELEIGEIEEDVRHLLEMLVTYEGKIRDSQMIVRNFDIRQQMADLENLVPKLKSHFFLNNYEYRDFLEDKVRIGLDKDSNLVYVAINVGTDIAYLNKAIPGLASASPFNSARTVNLLSKLSELRLIGANSLMWEQFIKQYIFPTPEILSADPLSIFQDQQQNTKSILEQLTERFDNYKIKSDRMLGEEQSIYGSVDLLTSIYSQQVDKIIDVKDAVTQNFAHIASGLANPASTACGAAATVYNQVLNHIDYKSLAATALECLKTRAPFDCKDVVLTVASVNVNIVYSTFKLRMDPTTHDVLEQALQVAIQNDFTLYMEAYAGLQFYLPLEEEYKEKTEGERFLGALEWGITQNGLGDYDAMFQEVCSKLSNPKTFLVDVFAAFSIPLFIFRENMPTVNLDGSYTRDLERMFLEMISSIIVGTVQTLLDAILNNCTDLEGEELDYGEGIDITTAMAEKVGLQNLGQVLGELLDSVGSGATTFSEAVSTDTAEIIGTITGSIDLGQITEFTPGDDVVVGTVNVGEKIRAMQHLFNVLKELLTSSEIIMLLEGTASTSLLATVLSIIYEKENNISTLLTIGPNAITRTEDVEHMFSLISNLADIGPSIRELNIVANQLGCSLSDFVEKRVPFWCAALPSGTIDQLSGTVTSETRQLTTDIIKTIYEPAITTWDFGCCDDPTISSRLAPRDTPSFDVLLNNVLKTYFDTVYMAYDGTILTMPEPFMVLAPKLKSVSRVFRADTQISFDYFNFAKLQEEKYEINPLQFRDDGQTKKGYVMNPEFQRMLSDGYVPPDGAPNATYGPYTTPFEKPADGSLAAVVEWIKRLLTGATRPLGPVDTTYKVPTLAANSISGLENLNKLTLQFRQSDADIADTVYITISSPPLIDNVEAIATRPALQLSMARDGFIMKVGYKVANLADFLPDPNLDSLTATTPYGVFFDREYSGSMFAPVATDNIISYISARTDIEETSNSNSMITELQRFMQIIARNGTEHFGAISGPTANGGKGLNLEYKEDLKNFINEVAYGGITRQIFEGISRVILKSPMLRYTDATKKPPQPRVPFMSIVDWAPLPSEEEAECGYDPHILSLDTMMKRVKQDYEEKMSCYCPEDEVSVNGLGREGLSSLEQALLSGCILTTVRTYALEQLLRTIFPVSVYSGIDLLTKVQLQFIVDEVNKNIFNKSSAYYDEILTQAERVFAERMKKDNPYGTIPDITDEETGEITKGVITKAEEVGVQWSFAQEALDEFYATDPTAIQPVIIPGVTIEQQGDSSTAPPSSGDPNDPVGTTGDSSNPPLSSGAAGTEGAGAAAELASADDDIIGESARPDGNSTPDICIDINSATVIPETPLRDLMKDRFAFLIEEQLYSLIEKLQDLVSFGETLSFDDNFLTKILPMFDIQESIDEPRFVDVRDPVTIEKEALETQYGIYENKFQEWKRMQQEIPNLIMQVGVFDDPAPDNGTAYSGHQEYYGFLREMFASEAFANTTVSSITENAGTTDLLSNFADFLTPEDQDDANLTATNAEGSSANNDSRYRLPVLKDNDRTDEIFYEQREVSGDDDNPGDTEPVETYYYFPKDKFIQILDRKKKEYAGLLKAANDPSDPFTHGMRTSLLGLSATVEDSDNGLTTTQKIFWSTRKFLEWIFSEPDAAANLDEKIDLDEAVQDDIILDVTVAEGIGTGGHISPVPRLQDIVIGIIDHQTDFGNTTLAESISGADTATFSLGDGGGTLILERYIKRRKPGYAQDTFPGERYDETTLNPLQVPSPPEEPSALTQILAPRETLNTSARNTRVVDNPPIATPPSLAVEEHLGGEINVHDEEIINISNFEKQFAGDGAWVDGTDVINPDDLVSDIYSPSFGIRISYIAPDPGFELAENEQSIAWPLDNSPITSWKDGTTKKNWFFDDTIVNKSKAYRVREKYERHWKTEEGIQALITAQGYAARDEQDIIGEEPLEPFSSTTAPTSNTAATPRDSTVLDSATEDIYREVDSETPLSTSEIVSRVLTVLPLFSAELPIAMPPNTKVKDFLTNIGVGAGEYETLDATGQSVTRPGYANLKELFNSEYTGKLIDGMKRSSSYNLLFKYSFPVTPILSAISVYSNLINEIPAEFFDATKEALKNILEIAANGGDYTFETDSEKKSGGNRGAYAFAKANYGTDGRTRVPSLYDLAVKTPKLIFKGLAEFIDPVIAPAAKIVKAGNAGRLIPQTMKILNPDYSPGGADDSNYFLTDVVFPAGSIPPPLGGDITGQTPTVIQKENIIPDYPTNQEFPIFRIRDGNISGVDIGNPIFDRYIQDVFANYRPDLADSFNYYNGLLPGSDLTPADARPQQKLFQEFALATVLRDYPSAANSLFASYVIDLRIVARGIIKEIEHPSSGALLSEYIKAKLEENDPFSPELFAFLRKANDTVTCGVRDIIIGILKGERVVEPSNFKPSGAEGSVATGFLTEIVPVPVLDSRTGETQVSLEDGVIRVKLDSPVVHWVVWGEVNGSFTVSGAPRMQFIWPGYPLPLPITPVAMASIPRDMVPGGYGIGPPHSPLGHIYHAIVAQDTLASVNLEERAIMRKRAGIENKKKSRGKLCIDIEQMLAEEKKRLGLE